MEFVFNENLFQRHLRQTNNEGIYCQQIYIKTNTRTDNNKVSKNIKLL